MAISDHINKTGPAYRKPAVSMAKTEPLIRQMKKARKNSPIGKLEALLNELTRWKRKRTIAENKLDEIRTQIYGLAYSHAQQLSGVDPKTGKVADPETLRDWQDIAQGYMEGASQ